MTRRRIFIYIVASLGGAATGTHFLTCTTFLENTKKAAELKINGQPVAVPDKLKNLFMTVTNEMKLSQDNKKLIRPYMTPQMDITYLGYSNSSSGSYVGLPQNFMFDNKDNINIVGMIDDLKIPDNYIEGFKTSILLSEDAKKFAIAQQIYESLHNSLYAVGFFPVLLAGLVNVAYIAALKVNKTESKYIPALIGIQCSVIALTLHSAIKNIFSLYIETVTDFEAANLGMSYLKGGIEYYEKMLQRNELLKKFNNSPYFEKSGDFNFIPFVQCRVSLIKRIIYLRHLKQAVENNSEKPEPGDYFSLEIFFGKYPEKLSQNVEK